MKKLLAFVFAGLMSVWGVAQATVIMTDGMSVTYDPNETYVPSGTLGPDIFSIGWTYNDTAYSNTIVLTAPDGLTGQLEWAITTGQDASGIFSAVGALFGGQSATVVMGNFGVAPATSWFSMRALYQGTPIAFGPTVPDSLLSFPGIDDTGNGGGVSPIPEPSTAWLLLAGLGGLLGITASRRKKSITPVP